ncbi:MAG: hypothetical protein NVSMB56_10080 [Pyrinomonadaceae bacterium]
MSQVLKQNLPTGALSNSKRAQKLTRREKEPPLEHGIKNIFMGLAFAVIALVLMETGKGDGWWFWMLIPAFTLLGKGVAQLMRWRMEHRALLPSRHMDTSNVLSPARNTGELPPMQTPAHQPPLQVPTAMPKNLSLQQPPSVTEATTRHLDAKTPVEALFDKKSEL